jgi:hypothetical protein
MNALGITQLMVHCQQRIALLGFLCWTRRSNMEELIQPVFALVKYEDALRRLKLHLSVLGAANDR